MATSEEHPPLSLARSVTMTSIGLKLADEDEELKPGHRWGWSWADLLSQCKICFL
jgi:hypothetical protein